MPENNAARAYLHKAQKKTLAPNIKHQKLTKPTHPQVPRSAHRAFRGRVRVADGLAPGQGRLHGGAGLCREGQRDFRRLGQAVWALRPGAGGDGQEVCMHVWYIGEAVKVDTLRKRGLWGVCMAWFTDLYDGSCFLYP